MFKKRALVFGNNHYAKSVDLSCCIQDAQDINLKLREIGFEVVVDYDQSYEEMTQKIIEFKEKIERNDLVVFFFSGHGVEWKGQTYLLPTNDKSVVELPAMCEHHAVSVQQTLRYMMSRQPSATIFLLDCCRLPIDNHQPIGNPKSILSNEKTSHTLPITGVAGSLVAYACDSEGKTFDNSPNRKNSLFTYHLLQHITKPDLKIEGMMTLISNGIYEDTKGQIFCHRYVSLRTSKIYLNQRENFRTARGKSASLYSAGGCQTQRVTTAGGCQTQRVTTAGGCQTQRVTTAGRCQTPEVTIAGGCQTPEVTIAGGWQTHGVTIAGGRSHGNSENQLSGPCGLFVDENHTVYIADYGNHRIMAWMVGATRGEVLAGGNGEGDRLDQLNHPTDVIVDRQTDSLLICDRAKRRLVRWPCHPSFRCQPEIVIDNIDCFALAMDDYGSLYVSDYEKHAVRRYDDNGDKNGTVVAGGHREGANLNQLNFPTYLFVDDQSTLYVSDTANHRIMKWMEGDKEGTIVAGGNGQGEDLTQLSYPRGVWVDEYGHVYVADAGNHRVIRWEKGAKRGTVVLGANGEGGQANQLSYPEGLFFAHPGHLYVADKWNHRVQRFSLF